MAVIHLPDWMTPREFKGPVVRKYTLKSQDTRHGVNTNIDYEQKLNDQQRAVVLAGGGPTLVIAGAGSGKTHTLTYRVAYLVERGIAPDKILLLTFTNKAARAMIDRVAGVVGDEVKKIWAGTFHSIANRILRQDAQLLGYAKDYTILDLEDARTLMKTCVAEADIDKDRKMPGVKVLVGIHSMCVNTQRTLGDALEERYPYFLDQEDDIRAVLELYQARKFEMALMDFDDLLLNVKRILCDFPDRLEHWSGKFEHLLVDEYQDTNHLQGEIVDMLAKVHGNLMVVGDDCQSIYAFRGADYTNILEFPQRYPACTQYKLEINYRSTPQILDLANMSIAENKNQFHKTLTANRPEGPKPALVAVKNVYQQAEFVCQRIIELADEGVPLSEVAILYRSHYHSMELQVEMTKRNIPYVVRSGMRFFEQAHIKDVLAYLRFIFNPRDEISFMRLAQQWRGVGTRRAQQLWEQVHGSADPLATAASEELLSILPSRSSFGWRDARHVLDRLRKQRLTESPGEMIQTILDGGYADTVRRVFENPQNRLGDLEQLANYAAQYDELDRFLGEISLLTTLTGQDILVGGDAPDEYVTLTSIHQAKGLEWSACFVLWLADGFFPSSQSANDPDQLEEERRLFYVATTRARDDLYMCHPFTHNMRGRGTVFLRPSLFVAELEQPDDPDQEAWERWIIDAG